MRHEGCSCSAPPRQACTADALELHSYGMLLPCGERYRGVEYVCCPGRAAAAASSKGDAEGGEGPPTGSQTLTLPAPGKTSSV